MITARDKFECAEREVKQRQRVYARLVTDGKMSLSFAQHQVAIMEAIRDDYREQSEAEDSAGRLL